MEPVNLGTSAHLHMEIKIFKMNNKCHKHNQIYQTISKINSKTSQTNLVTWWTPKAEWTNNRFLVNKTCKKWVNNFKECLLNKMVWVWCNNNNYCKCNNSKIVKTVLEVLIVKIKMTISYPKDRISNNSKWWILWWCNSNCSTCSKCRWLLLFIILSKMELKSQLLLSNLSFQIKLPKLFIKQ